VNIDMSDVMKDGDRTACVADKNLSDVQHKYDISPHTAQLMD